MNTISRRSFFQGAAVAASAARVMGANDRINVGLIGIGGRGTAHLNSYVKIPDCQVAALCDVNQAARELYHQEVEKLTDLLNKSIPEDRPKLKVPDLKFNRQIGQHAGKHFTLDGEPLTAEEYEKYLPTVMPSAEDDRVLASIMKEKDWILPKKEEEFVPSEGATPRSPAKYI